MSTTVYVKYPWACYDTLVKITEVYGKQHVRKFSVVFVDTDPTVAYDAFDVTCSKDPVKSQSVRDLLKSYQDILQKDGRLYLHIDDYSNYFRTKDEVPGPYSHCFAVIRTDSGTVLYDSYFRVHRPRVRPICSEFFELLEKFVCGTDDRSEMWNRMFGVRVTDVRPRVLTLQVHSW